MAQFGWCSLKSSRRLSTHIHLQINKINSIFPNILPLFQSGCRSQQTNSALIYRVARSKRHPSDGSSHCNVLEAKTQYSSGTSLRCPLDIFAPALPPFPASRYAELVSGGHLPTIAVRGRTAPSLYVFLASLELSFWLATLSSGCIACSRTSANSPWQGDASIRFLWHIDCQSEIDELVSMSSRPVDRGSCRSKGISIPFHPVKSLFGRMGTLKMSFHPVKGGFARTKLLIAEVQAQASRHIELGAALVSSVYSMLKAPFHFLQQSSYVVARGKSLCLRSQQSSPSGGPFFLTKWFPPS